MSNDGLRVIDYKLNSLPDKEIGLQLPVIIEGLDAYTMGEVLGYAAACFRSTIIRISRIVSRLSTLASCASTRMPS